MDLELRELTVVDNRWHATVIDDKVPSSRATEFPAFMPLMDVVTIMKQRSPRMLICGAVLRIPQPRAESYWADYLAARRRLDAMDFRFPW